METLIDYLEKWEAEKPDQILYRFVDVDGHEIEHYTYQSFAERTRELAAYLYADAGLRKGDRALLVYPPGLEMVAALFACARIGVIAVPVSPPLPMTFEAGLSKLSYVARDCQAKAVLSTKQFEYDFRLLLGDGEGAQAWPGAVRPPELPWHATDAAQDFGGGPVPDSPNSVLFLQYTSGSTNDPKGVVVSHANVIANSAGFHDDNEVAVSWLPQHHDMGLISAYFFILVLGGTTHAMSPADFLVRPAAWLRLISDVRATHSPAPNFALEYCLREDKLPSSELEGIDLSSLESIVVGAEPLRAKSFTRFRERFAPYGLDPSALTGAHGLAENTLVVSMKGRQTLALNKRALDKNLVRVEKALPENNNQAPVVSCGKPLDGNIVRIVDPESRQDLGEGRIGEIWVDGPSKAGGYWRRPEKSAETFEARIVGDAEHTYLRTGDLGFLYEGELFCCGRTKDLIIVRGVNSYPGDIESVVEQAAEIRKGCTAAFSVERDDEEVLVVVAEVRDENKLPDGKALARTIRRQCHIDPHTIVFARQRSVPKTTSGKIRRAETRKRWLNGELPVLGSYSNPVQDDLDVDAGPLERFRYLVESYDLSGDEDCSFADLGIDSLTLAELRTDLQRLLEENGAGELADEVNTRLLQRLTVAELFQLVRQFDDDSGQPLQAVREQLDRISAEYEAYEAKQMRADAQLALPELPPARPGTPTDILFTGATGFLGPFLLSNLLAQTGYTVHALVRATDAGHGLDRIIASLRRAQLWSPELDAEVRSRVKVICGNLAEPNLGIGEAAFGELAERIDMIVHNGALVDYVRTYDGLRPANVLGTRDLLRLAMTTHRKAFHLVSSTFIYGWSTLPVVGEWDANTEMKGLDFGYSQTKWVAEQLTLAAQQKGLDVRIYRPSLISPTSAGFGSQEDILVRLTAFMIQHGIAVNALNQVSLLPADLIGEHIVALMGLPAEAGTVFNMTADDYYNLTDVTRILSERYGYRFDYHDIPSFAQEANRRCGPRDPLFPLVDFLIRSADKISAMRDKRYDNAQYRYARALAKVRLREPALTDTVDHLVRFLRQERLITESEAEAQCSA
ncbi:thioester reductase domain-containing protein [Mycobacterium shimoidei]|uniref:thioester reductase domain-containing protein n=1 Tax=Mycobacterium shimoidei TaxID=29313 RepID=UPI00084848ED|nr:thioester reductase domain-containing protein [Mycobacterium shimoidei]MCV7257569.1 thioester reductase domain-containing protein [Mycobacterium shimoidei]ODR06366.1 fatty acyl-AMP ligase [Mycobacterium shimoidei]ORW82576.1 fatty acyl-AMP ligase [Mycobacterium shimoidei]